MIHSIAENTTQLGNRFITCTCGHRESGMIAGSIAEQNMAYHISQASAPVACDPSEANWYVEVIHDLPDGGDCDYIYNYYKGPKPTQKFARAQLVPDGKKLLECKINKCGRKPGMNSTAIVINKIKAAMADAENWMKVGVQLKAAGIKYDFSTQAPMPPAYIIKVGGDTWFIVNEKYADDGSYTVNGMGLTQ
jgi:hypothetical protein